jgi:predicted transglutaminase-like cysteine proteinase
MIPFDLLDEVNHKVNHTLTYTPDGLIDKWEKAAVTDASMRGDCEDFAILKGFRLVKMHGCDAQDMQIGKFKTSKGKYHAILMVESERTTGFFRKTTKPCTYLLDNRWDAIYTIDQIRDKLISVYGVSKYI